MKEEQVRAMMEMSLKLDRFEYLLRSKCEICGPILRGEDAKKYPKCKRHSH